MAIIQLPPDGAGKRIDTVTLTDATVEVHRQKIVITGGSGTAEVVAVVNSSPASDAMGIVVRQAGSIDAVCTGTFNLSGTAVVSGVVNISAMPAIIGTVNLSGTSIVAGNINISAMPAITGTVNISGSVACAVTGTVNISGTALCAVTGTINVSGTAVISGNINISTMPATTGLIGLTAGSSNIGFLDSISRTVQVAIGTPFTLQGISTTIQCAIATPFTIQAISTTVQIAVATPFTINNISATVSTVLGIVALATASHGPATAILSTSATAILVAAPGVGLSIYLTHIDVSNSRVGTGVSCTWTLAEGATPRARAMIRGSAIGGLAYDVDYNPPFKLSANTALNHWLTVATSEVYVNYNFYVAA